MKSAVQAPVTYWFPARMEPPADYADRFTGPHRFARNAKGPAAGVVGLLAVVGAAAHCVYRPAEQTWHDLGDGAWIGVHRAWRPEQFHRPGGPGGAAVTLGGRTFVVPCANPDLEACQLPRVPWPTRGRVISRVRSDCYALSEQVREIARDMRAAFLHADPFRLAYEEALQIIADAVALNYDLTLTELYALEILDDESRAAALYQITGWQESRAAVAADVAALSPEVPSHA